MACVGEGGGGGADGINDRFDKICNNCWYKILGIVQCNTFTLFLNILPQNDQYHGVLYYRSSQHACDFCI